MKHAYLEPNAINRAQDAGVDGASIRASLESRGFEPVVGIHTLYELARAFLNPDLIAFGERNFRVIRDLALRYSRPVDVMLGQELDHFLDGVPVQPLLARHYLRATELEVAKLSSGILSETGRRFIAQREAEIRANFPGICAGFIAQVDGLRAANPESLKALRTFDDVLAHFHRDIPTIIEKVLQDLATRTEASGLALVLSSYSAVQASVRAKLYLISVCVINRVRPAFDKLDDNRHATDAAYFHVLVTNDAQLTQNAPKIAPSLTVVSWQDIAP